MPVVLKLMGNVHEQIKVWVEFNVQHKYMVVPYMLFQTIYVLLAYFDLDDFFFYWNLMKFSR